MLVVGGAGASIGLYAVHFAVAVLDLAARGFVDPPAVPTEVVDWADADRHGWSRT